MGSSGSFGYSQKYVDDLRKKNEAAERRFWQQMHDLTIQAQTSKAQHDQTILTLQSQQREASLENKMKLELLKQQQEATKAQSERALAVLQRQQDEAKAQSARALESMEEMCRDTKEQLRTQTQQNEELKKQMSELRKKFEAPLRERKKIVTKINDMKLVIRVRSSIILMGSKGVGKSTFLHLIREGLGKPSNSSSDGTKKFQYGEKFIDSIGADISISSILKLIVLCIFNGFPSDLILFAANPRIENMMAIMHRFGLARPMLVMFANIRVVYDEVYKKICPMVRDMEEGVARFQGPGKEMLYDERMYERVKEANLAFPTYHDTVDETLADRKRLEVPNPFKQAIDALGGENKPLVFSTDPPDFKEHNAHLREAVLAFISIYMDNYMGRADGDLKFMNEANLSMIDKIRQN